MQKKYTSKVKKTIGEIYNLYIFYLQFVGLRQRAITDNIYLQLIKFEKRFRKESYQKMGGLYETF